MSQEAVGFKPKKSVALSGVPAGNTALCTVGRSGNDLSYRGYDILELADSCTFEEIAYLLVYGKLRGNVHLFRQTMASKEGIRLGILRRCRLPERLKTRKQGN